MTSLNLETFRDEQDILFFDTKATARLTNNRQYIAIDFVDETRKPESITVDEFSRQWGRKIQPVPRVSEAQMRMPLSIEQGEKILRATRTVEAMIETGPGPGGKKHRERVCKKVAQQYGYQTPTPPKTAYNWYVAHHNEGGLYHYFTSRQKNRERQPRFSSEVIDMAHDLLADTMFNPALLKIKLTTVHEVLVKRIKRLDPALAIPSYETLRSWFLEYDPFAVKQSKEGHISLRKARAQNATGQYCFFRPLQRVEADAMHVTLNIVDNQGSSVAKKIIIYFLIDCFSRSVLGFHLQVGGGETEAGVVRSIRHAILTKDNEHWIQCGLPSQIVVDGGVAYRSLTTQSEILSLGIASRIVATGAGYRKPFVERFIRTCRDLFFSTLPGYLGKQADQKRAGLLIDKSVPYTEEDIRERLTTWITDKYHRRRHLGLFGSTPLATWRQGILDHPVPYVENHASADIWLGKTVYPTISGENCHLGVQIETIKYNDRDGRLQRIGIDLKNKHKSKPAQVKCFWNESDISAITVIDPMTHNAFRVPASSNQHIRPGMSKAEYEEAIARLYPTDVDTDDQSDSRTDWFDDPEYRGKVQAQRKCIKQQQRSRAASAREGDLTESVAARFAGTDTPTLSPVVDSPLEGMDDEDDGLEVYDYD